ncbi:MAG: hypothetical protein Q7S08_01080 [bacterium]|nr:hypothetical protein [bacterium]
MDETHYFKTLLLWILGLFIISLIVYWAWSGGYSKMMSSFRSISNPFSSGSGNDSANSFFRLPWQPTLGAIPTEPPNPVNPETSNLQNEYVAFEGQYEQMSAQETNAKVFGDPSPEKGRVRITEAYGTTESDASKEYVVLTASTGNTAPIELTGWSLQSAYTGVRAYIPLSASAFLMGVINDQENVFLNAGASAIVISGSSPVATSFRENICSGYLGQLQRFFPPLSNSCPPASVALPFTPDNLKVYGDTCFNFLQNIPACTAPLQNIPSSINPNCRAFAANVLSYNGCVATYRYRPTFNFDSWRLYLGSNAELWSNTHDIIRLLDGEGRTVDVFTY